MAPLSAALGRASLAEMALRVSTRTSWPSARSLSTKALPTKPVAPVTATTIFPSSVASSAVAARTTWEVDARSGRRVAEAARRGAAARERLESTGAA